MERFALSVYNTCTNKDKLSILYYIDEDDSPSISKLRELKTQIPVVDGLVGPRITLSDTYNKLYPLRPNGDLYALSGDDCQYLTQNWDGILREAYSEYKDKILFAYGDDLLTDPSSNFGPHGFLSKEWINVVGRMTPPVFCGNYCDSWINQIADLLNRKKRLEIVVEHLHYTKGKSLMDKTSIEVRQREAQENVIWQFYSRQPELMEEAAKLQHYIDNFPKKDIT